MSTTEHEKAVPAEASDADATETASEAQSGDQRDDQLGEESLDESLEIEVEAVEGGVAEVDEDPMSALKAQVENLEAEKKENYERFVRASADLENFRKRSKRDVKDARLDERGRILKDMLPVVDNLERAVEHAKQTESEATKSIIEGVTLVMRQFSQALERHNVKALDAIGKPFDPAMHEAVSQAPSADHPPGTVIAVLQTGYMMEERLLRPALAVVSVAAPTPAEPADDATDAEGGK